MKHSSHLLAGIAACFITCAVLIGELFYFHSHKSAQPPVDSASPTITTTSTASPLPQSPSSIPDDVPEKKLSLAFQKLIEQNGFHTNTDATLHLKGHLIKGTRKIHSDIDILHATESDKMQMDMNTATISGKKNETTHSAYYQGWYCTDSKKKHIRTERSEESVLSLVTFISDILSDATDQIEHLTIKKEGDDTIYQFSLPHDIATDYFCQMVEQASLDTKELRNVSGEVKKLLMTCRLNKKGILIEQTASISGKVSRSIFSIPISLQETSTFSALKADFTITPPNLNDYKIIEDDS